MEDESHSIPSYPARISHGMVEVSLIPQASAA